MFHRQKDISDSNEPQSPSFIKEIFIFLWELVKIIVISLVIIIPVRYFLIQPFYVKGASMDPNFEDHQYLIIDEITYRFRNPERGEVVVFRFPLRPQEFYIKRIIGLPNEQVRVENNKIFIYSHKYPDGLELKETYLPPGISIGDDKTVQLSDSEYYVMGDNRSESYDSRAFGAVHKRFITGRVFFRGWPFDKMKVYWQPPG